MTCGLAVKRPLDLGQDSSLVDVKRPRHSGASPQCSPFRPQLGILATSLRESTSAASSIKPIPTVVNSPFAEVSGRCQLSSNQLDSYLRAEIQYLKRRKLIPRRQGTMNAAGDDENSCMDANNFRKAASPSSSNSGSDSEGEMSMNAGTSMGQGDNKKALLEALYEKPQFSLRQVKLICERLLKEQEMRLRYEYETLLNKKLEEQHDQYVQFAREQLEANAAKLGDDISYLS